MLAMKLLFVGSLNALRQESQLKRNTPTKVDGERSLAILQIESPEDYQYRTRVRGLSTRVNNIAPTRDLPRRRQGHRGVSPRTGYKLNVALKFLQHYNLHIHSQKHP